MGKARDQGANSLIYVGQPLTVFLSVKGLLKMNQTLTILTRIVP